MLANPAAFAAAAALFGLAIGSFLNVVIWRLPQMLERRWRAECAALEGRVAPADGERFDLIRPRSRCPSCGAPIRALHNVPVLSFIVLGGRCASCRAPIPLRYPAIELATAALFALTAWHFGFGWQAALALLFTAFLVALAGIDLDRQLLPDALTLPLLWIGLLASLAHVEGSAAPPVAPRDALAGAAAGYLFLWSVFQLFRLITGKEGMGYGDFKLFAAVGAFLGWQMLPLVILASSFVGAIAGIALMILARRGRDVPIPFGPYLAGAGLIALFWGQELVDRYLAQLL